MTTPSTSLLMLILLVAGPLGCHCAGGDDLGMDSESSSSGGATAATSTSDEASTGVPFDASRWLGRYHLESFFLPFGERGDPQGAFALANFEIFPDSRATMLYDECSFEEPIVITYEWQPSDDGWLSLRPGPDEPSLRYMAASELETLRIRLIEPCRALRFEVDGQEDGFAPFHPGESCWVDRCTTPGIMQVDYCEGEQPPPCP